MIPKPTRKTIRTIFFGTLILTATVYAVHQLVLVLGMIFVPETAVEWIPVMLPGNTLIILIAEMCIFWLILRRYYPPSSPDTPESLLPSPGAANMGIFRRNTISGGSPSRRGPYGNARNHNMRTFYCRP